MQAPRLSRRGPTSTAGSPLIIQNLGPVSIIGQHTSVTLNGAGSLLTADGTTDALTSLSEVDGSLTLSGGRSLTLSGISTFTNTGSLQVDNGSVLDASAGAFKSLDTNGSLSGNYNIGGTFQYTPQALSNGYVLTNNGNITLNGVNSLITFDGTTDALTQLTTNNGGFTLSGTRSLTLSGVAAFTNAGSLQVDAGSIFDTGGATLQSLDTNGNLSGQYTIGGTFNIPRKPDRPAMSRPYRARGVTLNGPGSLMTFDGTSDALSQLSTNNGNFTLTGGRSLTLSGITTFTNAGSLRVDAGSTLDTTAGAFQSLDTSGNLTGHYQIGGTFQFTPQAGSDGNIVSIDSTASVRLSGSGQILYGSGPGTNALSNLAVNNGQFGLTAAAALTLSGGLTNGTSANLALDGGSQLTVTGLLQNNGEVSLHNAGTTLLAQGYSGSAGSELRVGGGAIADLRSGANGGFQNLVNSDGVGTLTNGTFVVGGTLKIDGADDGLGGTLGIAAIDSSASLTLSGTGQILYGAGSGSNALSQPLIRRWQSVAGAGRGAFNRHSAGGVLQPPMRKFQLTAPLPISPSTDFY